jgi:hypothetical protein
VAAFTLQASAAHDHHDGACGGSCRFFSIGGVAVMTSRLLLLAVVGFCAALPSAAAQPPNASYRRVLVPQDSIQSQIRGLLPLRRDEFERRVKLAGQNFSPLADPSTLRIEAIAGRARLIEDRLESGTMELDIVSRISAPVLLSLEPCNVTLGSVAWGEPGDRAAIVGADSSGLLSCLVERSGKLRLAWTLEARSTDRDSMTFDLRLPPVSRCVLEIELPLLAELTAENGIVTRGEEIAERPQWRLWTVELDGHGQTTLHIRSAPLKQQEAPLVIVREATTYTVLPSTLDLETTLTLDVPQKPLRRLLVQADTQLKLVSIRLGDQTLSFSPSRGDDQSTLVEVTLPETLLGLNHALHITATTDWDPRKPFRLPGLRVADGVYQNGHAEILAPAWMRLFARPVQGCYQAAVFPAVGGASLDQFDFHLHEPGAAIEIAADPQSAALRANVGTQIRIDASQVTGVLVAELSTLGGHRFEIDAVVPPNWIIDAVETQPGDALAERRRISRGGQNLQRLKLVRPLGEARPLRLIIRAHYRRPPNNEPFTGDFFRLANFLEARDNRHLLAVRVDDPSAQLQLTGDDLVRRLDPEQLSPSDSRLFESAPGPLLFEDSAAAPSLAARLVPTMSRYRADVVVQALADLSDLRQTASIRCQPEAAAVGSLLVRLAPPPPAAVSWRIAGEDSQEIQATLVNSEQTGASEAATYRLTLLRPRSSPFEVLGEWPSGLAAEGDIVLAWLPEATAQTNLIEVHFQDGARFSIQAEEIQALPLPHDASDRFTSLRARYRYEAARRARLRLQPVSEVQTMPPAWIGDLQLVSRFSANGRGDHELKIAVENRGMTELALQLPSGVGDVRAAGIESGEDLPLNVAPGGKATIPLPAGRRQAVLGISYSSQQPPLTWRPVGAVTVPIPEFDIPVMTRRWLVSLSPGLATADERAVPVVHERNLGVTAVSPLSESRQQVGARQSLVAALAGSSLLTNRLQQPASESTDSTFAGWTTLELELPPGPQAALTVYRPAAIQAWALCLGLGVAVVALWARRYLIWEIPLAGLLTSAALIASPPSGWLLLGGTLGLVLGLIAKLARSHLLSEQPQIARTRLPATSPASSAAAVVVVLLSSTCMAAQDLQDLNAKDAPRPRVVVPVDDEQQPVGEYVYLDPTFYDALHRLTEDRTALPPYLLEASHFDLPAKPTGDGAIAALDNVHAEFHFHTFHPAVNVEMPLRRDQIFLWEGQARLDGQPLAVSWRSDGAALTFPIQAPGKHRLDLTFGTIATRKDSYLLLNLVIPRAARADAAFELGADTQGVILSPRKGERDPEIGSLETEQGDNDEGRLVARWPLATEGSSRVEAEQLLWWNIRPGSVTVEGKFRLRTIGGSVHEALLEVDPRLRLVPGSTGNATARPVEGSSTLIRVEFSSPAADATFLLSWLWSDVSGNGTLALPRIALRADHGTRAWTAISTDASLRMEAPKESFPTVAQFMEAWGNASAQPNVVLEALPDAHLPPLVVRPAVSHPQAQQIVDWSLSSAIATAAVNLQLTTVPPVRLEHRLTMPRQLVVTSVALSQGGRPAQIRWSQQSNGLLVVTMLEPAMPQQHLVITAERPLNPQQPSTMLPGIHLEDAVLTSSVLRIYRRSDIQIDVRPAHGWTRQDDPALGQSRDGWGRLAAVLRGDGAMDDRPPIVVRTPNQPQVSGLMFIAAREDDGDWQGEVELQLDVTGGVLDQLRVTVPDEWTGPLEFDPPAYERVIPLPGESRQVLIRPWQSATQSLHLKIRGPLINAGGGVRVPNVTLLGEPDIRRFALLDVRAGGERIDWEMTGLRAADRSAVPIPSSWQALDGELFRVVAPRFDAVARILQPAAATPRALLADLNIRLLNGGRMTAEADYTIQPAGGRPLRIEMPPNSRLVQVLVDGSAAQSTREGPRLWTVSPPSTSLPCRLNVIYEGHFASPTNDEIRLAAPRLVDVLAEQTVWTVSTREGLLIPEEHDSSARHCTPFEVELVRLETATRAQEGVASAYTTDIPMAILQDVFERWRRTYADARRRSQTLYTPAEDDAETWSQRLAASERTVARIEQRLNLSGSSGMENDLPAEDASVPSHAGDGATHYFTSGPNESPSLIVRLSGDSAGSRRATDFQAVWAALIAMVSLLMWPTLHSNLARDWLAAHMHLLLAGFGFAWWLLAPVGWLGWALVLAAIWLALRWPWHPTTYDSGSSIRPALISHSQEK